MTPIPPIRIARLSKLQELAPLRARWNELALGVPFRGFDWLEGWWRAYGTGTGRELFVLTAHDDHERLVGIAPFYIETQSRVIHLLGSGEVTSDYLTVLCQREFADAVTRALADWLCASSLRPGAGYPNWTRLELNGVDERDTTVAQLLLHLERQGKVTRRYGRDHCWRLLLPPTWDEYLALLSKSHRKRVRRLDQKYFESGLAKLRTITTRDQLRHAFDELIELHQLRRQSLGEAGCFASPRFLAFQEIVMPRLLERGSLRLILLDIDGRPVAGEYQLVGDGVIYAYQSGMDPAAAEHQPGSLITLASLKQAIAEGQRAFDFLRGDEAYKAHWRARPHPVPEVRVSADTTAERVRHNLWVAGKSVKRWFKSLQTSGGAASQ